MTDDLSASRDRSKQLKKAVDEVDDFINTNCRETDEPLAIALEGITKMSSRLRKAINGEVWTEIKVDRQLTEVRKLVEGTGGRLVEVDTENSGSAVSVRKEIRKSIAPIMMSGRDKARNAEPNPDAQNVYLWHVPGEYDDNSDWRVIYTIPIPEDDFEKLVSAKYTELENEIAVATVMLS